MCGRAACSLPMKAFVVMGRTLKATYEELFVSVGVSLLWWLGVLLVVTAAPATMGLNAVANRIANYRRTGTEFFWSAARSNILRSWLLFGGMLVAFILIVVNIYWYSAFAGWPRLFTVAWLWVLLLFCMVGQYLFPLLNQQVEPDIKMALRNAGLLVMRSPLYSALALLFQLVLVAISVFLVAPVLLLLPALIALAQNFMLTGLLQEMGMADPPPAPARD